MSVRTDTRVVLVDDADGNELKVARGGTADRPFTVEGCTVYCTSADLAAFAGALLALAQAHERPTGVLTIEACPECRNGKHGNCDGTTLHPVTGDMSLDCPCTDLSH